MQLIRLFPDAAFFIEKPISAWEFSEVDKVREALQGRIVSVGYMLRYLKGESSGVPSQAMSLISVSCAGDEVSHSASEICDCADTAKEAHRRQWASGDHDYGDIPFCLVRCFLTLLISCLTLSSYAGEMVKNSTGGYWDKSLEMGRE
jgi:hypothetical protein